MAAKLLLLLGLLGGSVGRADEPPCALDPALDGVAAALLAGDLSASSSDALLDAARALGATAPSLEVRAFSLSDEAGREAWLRAKRARVDGRIACGEARTEARTLVVVAPALARLAVDGGSLHGSIEPGFGRPELVFRFVDGTLLRVSVDRDALARGVPLPPETEDGPTVVQLVATGRRGPLPLAELALNGTLDQAPASDARAHRDVDGPAWVAALRARSHRPALRDHRILAREAARHARAVCEEGRVAHRLERGDPEERLRARGVSARLVGETVARGASLAAAMRALEASPSHQMTLLDRRFTDLGVGMARDGRGTTCLVVLLAAWPRYLGR